jgi:hypothetical protein
MNARAEPARIYLRRNGAFGSSCDGIGDTGHFISEDSGRFTVYPDGSDDPIIRDASQEDAEAAITRDWRSGT